MKEKDLDRHLDNIIIDGLIKEAQQENADFEAAMRRMSYDELEELIYEPAEADAASYSVLTSSSDRMQFSRNYECKSLAIVDSKWEIENIFRAGTADEKPSRPKAAKKSKWQIFRPWIASAVVAVAVILIVLIPSVNAMNAKLCENALYVSSEYITSSRSASDIYRLSDDQLKARLPELEERYEECLETDKIPQSELIEPAWDLTLAYLRLHKRGDAERVLKELVLVCKGTPFGDHCRKLLKQL